MVQLNFAMSYSWHFSALTIKYINMKFLMDLWNAFYLEFSLCCKQEVRRTENNLNAQPTTTHIAARIKLDLKIPPLPYTISKPSCTAFAVLSVKMSAARAI